MKLKKINFVYVVLGIIFLSSPIFFAHAETSKALLSVPNPLIAQAAAKTPFGPPVDTGSIAPSETTGGSVNQNPFLNNPFTGGSFSATSFANTAACTPGNCGLDTFNASCPASPTGNLVNIIKYFICLIDYRIIPLFIFIAVIIFTGGAIRYLLNTADQEKRKEAAQFMTFGVIAFFVTLSTWGLVQVLQATFKLDNAAPATASFSCPAGASGGTLSTLANCLTYRIDTLIIPFFVTIALLLFIFGIVKYLAHADEKQARTDGAQFMLWGIIALFVMLSVWGLVAVLRSTFGVYPSTIPQFSVYSKDNVV